MKSLIFIAFLGLLILFSCKKDKKSVAEVNSLTSVPSVPVSPFSGSWEWEKNDQKNTFSVKMVQKKDSIFGTYCAVVRNGAKIDCGGMDGSDPIVSFAVPIPQGNTLEASFRNYFTGDMGKVKMSLYDGDMHWLITQEPHGECYAFRNALMKRGTDLSVVARADGSIALGSRQLKIDNLEQALTDTIQYLMRNYQKKPKNIVMQADNNVLGAMRVPIEKIIEAVKSKQ